MIDLVAVLSSIFLVATGFLFLKRIWELNYGIDIRREVYYLGLLMFCFTANRVSFLFNFFESGGDVVFDLTEQLGVSQTPIFSFLILLLPLFLFTYLFSSLGFSKKSLIIHLIPLLLVIVVDLYNQTPVIKINNLELKGILLGLISLGYIIEILIRLVKGKNYSDVMVVWVLLLLFIYSSGLTKILYVNSLMQYPGPDTYYDGFIFSNIFLGTTFLVVRFKFQRILTCDIRYEFLKKDILEKEVSDRRLQSYRATDIWRSKKVFLSKRALDELSARSRNLIELSSNEILSRLMALEIKFIRGEQDFKPFESIHDLSQQIGYDSELMEFWLSNYCNFSFSEYSKLIRVFRADYLILDGFLFQHKAEQLAEKSYFSNRVTLYNNFKKYLNTTISERSRKMKV